ncbi:MAG: Inorganic pyrophosphatase [Erysipelotrichia bacterium]|jgi:inorganic pyrophosphatase|nr:Inorganic pyrophosphatase [Erysipelotrichia bacterium]
MNTYENNAYFWQKIDTLTFSSHFVLSQPKGSSHQVYHNLIYPLDYGYLKDTLSADSNGIAMYKGSMTTSMVNACVIAADILKKDIEIKLLLGCTPSEEEEVLRFLNQTEFQKTVLIRRANTVPSWAMND